ncbi:hypothetical protein [Arthrobacter sp. GMC3]|uniref:hypothetical protein n=1 Tax=Arthrobacter sp. GMC3 TaxID=2058894 RepID=UPI000CE500B5|nr:hypothetical protein [Arthrobacter sp. GMC3]
MTEDTASENVFDYLEAAYRGCREMAQPVGDDKVTDLGMTIAAIAELTVANTIALQSLAKSLQEAGIDTTMHQQIERQVDGLSRGFDATATA